MGQGLFVLVEGPDDVRFFDTVLVPIWRRRYGFVKVVAWANRKAEFVNRLVRSAKGMRAEYVLVADCDQHPCVSGKRQWVRQQFQMVEEARILVVVREIEGWYVAGIEREAERKLRIRVPGRTDGFTKEDFLGMMPEKFERTDFMVEILKGFSIQGARNRNRSFAYGWAKHVGGGEA